MGFSCYICKKPFQEEEHASQKGGGDGRATANASATICGHLFHSKCLQDYFDKISRNAWSPKQCPVCSADLGVRDVIRVHAYPFDSNNFPAVEDLQEQLKQIQQEKTEAFKRYEAVYKENCSLKYSLEARMHEGEEWAIRYDQLLRLNKAITADNELFKNEIVKLKNMVIKLTERITGIDEIHFQDAEANNGMATPANLGGSVPFIADPAGFNGGYELHMASNNNNYSFNNNGSPMKSVSYSHPPGFIMLQPDNGSDLSPSPTSGPDITGSQQRRTLTVFGQDSFQVVARECNNNITSCVGSGRPQHQSVPLFARVQKDSSPSKDNDNSKNAMNEELESISHITATMSIPAKASDFLAESNHPGPNEPGRGNISRSPFPIEAQRPSDISSPKVTTTSDKNCRVDPTYGDYDDHETAENEKWFEKRSKRRSSGSRGGSQRSSLTNHARSDDKRYGYFKCSTCHAEWGSSKSVLNQPQVCRYCKTEVHPYKQDFILSRKQLELKQLEASHAITSPGASKKK